MQNKRQNWPLTKITNKTTIPYNKPYLFINLIIAGIILLLIIYSGIFSANGMAYPIKSATIQPTISTGLSRAFSEIVRFNFSAATVYNPYAISIFLFFFIQLILRFIISFLLFSTRISTKFLLITDILVSILIFLKSYYNFIIDQF